jgi:hypothetical protein
MNRENLSSVRRSKRSSAKLRVSAYGIRFVECEGRSAAMGFRRFLGLAEPTTPTEPADPSATGGYGARPFAGVTTQANAAPVSLASVDKKVVDVFAVESKKAVDPPRSRAGYVWVSQASRSRRAGWADFVNRTF